MSRLEKVLRGFDVSRLERLRRYRLWEMNHSDLLRRAERPSLYKIGTARKRILVDWRQTRHSVIDAGVSHGAAKGPQQLMCGEIPELDRHVSRACNKDGRGGFASRIVPTASLEHGHRCNRRGVRPKGRDDRMAVVL